MGALLSIPLLGSAGSMVIGLAFSIFGGIIGACSSKAASGLFKSCNCNSSIATSQCLAFPKLLNGKAYVFDQESAILSF